jgi:hypothetical protein
MFGFDEAMEVLVRREAIRDKFVTYRKWRKTKRLDGWERGGYVNVVVFA